MHLYLTKSAQEAEPTFGRLAARGCTVTYQSVIDIQSLALSVEQQHVLDDLDQFAGLIFTSRHAPQRFAEQAQQAGVDLAAWIAVHRPLITAVGPATAAACDQWLGVKPITPPDSGGALDLLPIFNQHLGKPHAATGRPPLRLLFPGAAEVRPDLPQALSAQGYDLLLLPLYRTTPRALTETDLAPLAQDSVDLLGLTSPSSVESLWRACRQHSVTIKKRVTIVTIGGATSDAVKKYGAEVGGEANTSNLKGMLDIIERLCYNQ